MIKVYILWSRNGWAGPEWSIFNIYDSADLANKAKQIYLGRYPESQGNECKITENKVLT